MLSFTEISNKIPTSLSQTAWEEIFSIVCGVFQLTFEEKIGECTWEVALLIPYKVFFKHAITGLDGMSIRANFYKCGDELQKPHFLSWSPIKIEKPDFHRPDFFGLLEFE